MALAKFSCQQLEFAFGAADKFMVGGKTFPPSAIDVGVPNTHIERFLLVVVHFPYESRTCAWKISVLNVRKQSQLLDVHCMNNGVQLGQK